MSQDNTLTLLLNKIQNETENSLWIADEHAASLEHCRANPLVSVVSNRFDVAENLSKQGWQSHFSDLDFDNIKDASLSRLYFRLSKEKPLAHHIFNQAARLLKPGGELIITGGKQQGIKNYAKNAAQSLAGKAQIKIHGNDYLATITRGKQPASPLDDKNYSSLRVTQHYNGDEVFSKPGQFGWDKLDQGSHLLAEQLKQLAINTPETILDLGCGYGFLSLAAHQQWPAASIDATDNNAAALLSCRENFIRQGIQGEVIAANCAENIHKRYALILCNPPFHQGFAVEQSLTERFIASAKRLCQPNGSALFVVNAFIPLENIACNYFNQVQLLRNDGHFKLFHLQT